MFRIHDNRLVEVEALMTQLKNGEEIKGKFKAYRMFLSIHSKGKEISEQLMFWTKKAITYF